MRDDPNYKVRNNLSQESSETDYQLPSGLSAKWSAIGAGACVISFGVVASICTHDSSQTEATTTVPDTPPQEAPAGNCGIAALGLHLILFCVAASFAAKASTKKDAILSTFLGSTLTLLAIGAAASVAGEEEPAADTGPDAQTEISAEEVIASQPSQQQATAPTTYIYQPGM